MNHPNFRNKVLSTVSSWRNRCNMKGDPSTYSTIDFGLSFFATLIDLTPSHNDGVVVAVVAVVVWH